MALPVDVSKPSQVASMIQAVKERYHKIDIYCSNAGIILSSGNQVTTGDSCVRHSLEQWNYIFQVNVNSHVTALRYLLPDWKRRLGDGHFCVTASAAGLLTMFLDASYGVSKAAAVSFCEHVAICHSDCVQVHCLCPEAVETNICSKNVQDQIAALTGNAITAEECANTTLRGIQNGDFYIFTHKGTPKVALHRAQDHERWLKGMRRLRSKVMLQSKL